MKHPPTTFVHDLASRLRCRKCCQGGPTAGGDPATTGLATAPPSNRSLTMCNLYSITTNQAAIIALFRVVNRYVGNLAPMPGVFPNYKAPIVRTGVEGRELATARWGITRCSGGRRAHYRRPAPMQRRYWSLRNKARLTVGPRQSARLQASTAGLAVSTSSLTAIGGRSGPEPERHRTTASVSC
jgi:hypothetical protein